MPVEEPEVVTYNNWKAGPWHSLGPDYGPSEDHNYDCVNMQVYANGSIGPRPCLVSICNGIDLWAGGDDSKFKGSFWYQVDDFAGGPLSVLSDSDARFQIVEGESTQYAFDHSAGANTTISVDLATFRTPLKPARYLVSGHASSPESVISSMPYQRLGDKNVIVGGDGYFTNLDDTGSDSYQAITASADGTLTDNEYPQNWDPTCLFSWRDRYWSWGDYDSGSNHNGNRIHYSAVGAIQTWGANDYIDVGADNDLPIIGVWQVFDNLLIAMADSRWYKYTFTDDPDFGEIRYIGTKIIPDFYVTAATTGSAIIYTTRQSGLVIATKDNIDDQTFKYITVPKDGDDSQEIFFLRGMSAHAHNAICLPYQVKSVSATAPDNVYKGDRSIDLVNGVWTHQLYFGTGDDSVLETAFVDAVPMGNDHWGFYAVDTHNTSSANDDTLYVRPVTLNRPSNNADAFNDESEVATHTTDADDRFEGTIWLSTYRPEEKNSASIEKVIIDFDFWNSTGFNAPAFTVKADCVHDGDEINTITVGSLDANELSSTSGTVYVPKRGRVVLRPARMPLSSQINVSITGIKSVAFKEISVVYAVQKQTPITNVNT